MGGVYQNYEPQFANCKLTENPSQDLAEKTDDQSQLRKKKAMKMANKQQIKMKKIENLTSISNNESESPYRGEIQSMFVTPSQILSSSPPCHSSLKLRKAS